MEILLFIITCCAVLGIWFFLLTIRYKKIAANWKIIRQKYNLKLELPVTNWSWFGKARPFAIGNINGSELRCETVSLTSTENNDFSTAKISIKKQETRYLHLSRASFFSAIGKILKAQDIEIGSPVFDKDFVVKADNEDFAKNVLTPKIQELLLNNRSPKAFFWLEDQVLYFEIPHNDLRNEQQCQGFLNSLEILLALASEIEKQS